MNTTRTDAFDPKLEDYYRLRSALQLIEAQDKIISNQATDIQLLKSKLEYKQNKHQEVYELLRKALNITHNDPYNF